MVCAISVKYNAIFTACIIFTIIGMDYWELIGNKNLSVINLLQHLVSYIGLLLLVPSLIYIGVFYVHLSILNQSGPHDDIMTSAFQATLQGGLSSITKGQPLEVSYGSQVTLRNTHGQNCWLHSHMYIYPIKYTDERGSSAQQQVTCYPFKDVNNWWIIKNPGRSSLTVDNPPKAVKHGDVIQLLHGTSGRALNSHDVAAPLSPHYMEVSCYIDYNISHPAQNLWKLEIANRDTEGDSWKSIQSRIRLVHMNTSQALKVTGRQLPDWGFHQFEVATDRILAQEGNIWNVEEHKYTRLPDQTELNFQDNSDVVSKLTFWEKLWEIQWKMLFATNDVTQEHQYSSEPNEWPFMEQGIAYWIDHNTNAQIYFLGNPIIWWMSSVGIIVYIILMVVAFIRRIRQCQDLDEESWERFVTSGVLFLGGWIINYLPFYLLERTLFLHHYLPALLFKIMLFPVAVELFSRYILRSGSQRQLFTWFLVPCCAQIVVTFVKFSPFSYGNRSVSSEEMEDCRWLDSWEFLQHGKLPY
ncbi:protein O-mannosyl-transferase 1-like [Saccoglossus kowalevskii]|uniref:dolichyl-phosphate-mannose--protein mannosyltransferase n=1 Tax=Saccoglossus kowalevskii TaxID=10224 RepID=A0ABM0LZM1_SACKO|nr:PREDICTED: protein O-mannosyl-transferase 1-like [Saccoglossus kowalevskii]